jgi:hypothetical protein
LLGDMPPVPIGLAGDLTVKPGQVDAKNLQLAIGDAELRGEGHLEEGDLPRATLTLHAATLDLQKGPPGGPRPAALSAAAPPQVPPPPALSGADKTPAASAAKAPPLPFLRTASVAVRLCTTPGWSWSPPMGRSRSTRRW